jgi:hypothetical protein
MSSLLASLDRPPSGRQHAIWFDAAGYGRDKLLAGRAVPWSSPADLTAFVGKLQGMFRSDVIAVDLAEVFAQRAAGDNQLRAAMTARARPGYALRTLLADERARGTAAEAVRALAATAGSVPLVLLVPAPGRWLGMAAELAGSEPGPADPDRAETAAMYVADMLRTFGGLGVDGLVVDEGPTPASGLIPAEASRSVLNVADHYQWAALVRTEGAPAWPHGPVPGVAAWIGSDPPPAPGQPPGRWGLVAGPDFWEGADPAPDADLVAVTIPAQAEPEAVMKRVRDLT